MYKILCSMCGYDAIIGVIALFSVIFRKTV